MEKKLQYPLLPGTVIPLLCSNKGCKDFYETLNRNNEKPTSQNKWINIYDIEENTWPEIYSSISPKVKLNNAMISVKNQPQTGTY